MSRDDWNKSYVGMLACANCGEQIGVLLDRRLKNTFENGTNYSDGASLCDNCQKLQDQAAEEVAKGGLPFRCKQCGSEGVIRLNDNTREMIEDVKSKGYGGIEYDKCEYHGGKP